MTPAGISNLLVDMREGSDDLSLTGGEPNGKPIDGITRQARNAEPTMASAAAHAAALLVRPPTSCVTGTPLRGENLSLASLLVRRYIPIAASGITPPRSRARTGSSGHQQGPARHPALDVG